MFLQIPVQDMAQFNKHIPTEIKYCAGRRNVAKHSRQGRPAAAPASTGRGWSWQARAALQRRCLTLGTGRRPGARPRRVAHSQTDGWRSSGQRVASSPTRAVSGPCSDTGPPPPAQRTAPPPAAAPTASPGVPSAACPAAVARQQCAASAHCTGRAPLSCSQRAGMVAAFLKWCGVPYQRGSLYCVFLHEYPFHAHCRYVPT